MCRRVWKFGELPRRDHRRRGPRIDGSASDVVKFPTAVPIAYRGTPTLSPSSDHGRQLLGQLSPRIDHPPFPLVIERSNATRFSIGLIAAKRRSDLPGTRPHLPMEQTDQPRSTY